MGIVGPFGIGKTTIVTWLMGMVKNDASRTVPSLLFSQHSCWAFEDSGSAIHSMLTGAIDKVAEHFDTFHVRSLPDSYRQMFTAGKQWLDSLSRAFFRPRDPVEQFRSLSSLLGEANLRLVIVVEDLDRNDSPSFDIQEVLAFLEQLKGFDNLSFLLTGAIRSRRRIDFARLCDHIEYLKTVDVRQAYAIVRAVRERCLDKKAHPHEVLTDTASDTWAPSVWRSYTGDDEMQPPEALTRLLDTPRVLRQALGRTDYFWQSLCGEVDWDHLLTMNALRSAAPECFSFLLRHWDLLRARPSSSVVGPEQQKKVVKTVVADWESSTKDVEWDIRAVRALVDFILPESAVWLGGESRPHGTKRVQGMHDEPYWRRAVNEAIDATDVRDQTVMSDFSQWRESPSIESKLVAGLCSLAAYGDAWERVAVRCLGRDSGQALLLCEHVLARLCREQGVRASHESEGFGAVFQYVIRHVERTEHNREWLQDRITAASATSLRMVNDLWHFLGAPGEHSLLRLEDVAAVREHEIRVLQERFVNGQALEQILDVDYPYIVYQLVFDPGDHNPASKGDLAAWKWLAPVLLDCLRRESTVIAIGVAGLIAARDSGLRREPWTVDLDVLSSFFAEDAAEVIRLLAQLAERVKMDEREFVAAIAESGRMLMAEGPRLAAPPGVSRP